MTETIGSMTDLDDDERLRIAHQLIEQAKASGIDLVGPGGVLTALTKTVLETAWRRRSPSIWAVTSTTRPGATATTRATARAPRRF